MYGDAAGGGDSRGGKGEAPEDGRVDLAEAQEAEARRQEGGIGDHEGARLGRQWAEGEGRQRRRLQQKAAGQGGKAEGQGAAAPAEEAAKGQGQCRQDEGQGQGGRDHQTFINDNRREVASSLSTEG